MKGGIPLARPMFARWLGFARWLVLWAAGTAVLGIAATVRADDLGRSAAASDAALPPASDPGADEAPPGSTLRGDAEMRFRGMGGSHLSDLGQGYDSANSGWYQRSRLGILLEHSQLSAYLQLQSSGALGAAGPGADPMPLGLQQGWLRARAQFAQELWLDAGRLVLDYGAGRQIGAYDFDTIGQAFDGVRAHYAIPKRLIAEVFAARLKPGAAGSDVRRGLSGTHLTATPNELLKAELYVLYLVDDNAAERSGLLTMGSRVVGGPWLGLSGEVEGAVQIGEHRHADSRHPTDRLAWMAASELNYRLDGRIPLSFSLFGHVFSGDDDATDATDRAWQPLYPSKDAVVGLLRVFEPSNLAQAGARLQWQSPSPAWPLTISADVRRSLAAAHGKMPVFGGDSVPGDRGWQDLASEVDLRVRWRVLPGSELMVAASGLVGSSMLARTYGADRALLALLQWTTRL